MNGQLLCTPKSGAHKGVTISAGARAFMPGMAGKIGVKASTAVDQSVTDSLTNHHYDQTDTEISFKIDMSVANYIYRGKTTINLVNDGPLVYQGDLIYQSNIPVTHGGCMRLNYRRRRTSTSYQIFGANDSVDVAVANFVDEIDEPTLESYSDALNGVAEFYDDSDEPTHGSFDESSNATLV